MIYRNYFHNQMVMKFNDRGHHRSAFPIMSLKATFKSSVGVSQIIIAS